MGKPMTDIKAAEAARTLDRFRRDAKALRKAHEAGEATALDRLKSSPPRPEGTVLKHADYLHVIARENSFASWPQLKFAVETQGLDRAAKQQRLGMALHHGQVWMVERLLEDTPDLAETHIGLACGLYLKDAVAAILAEDPETATRKAPLVPPLIHLARSRMWRHYPEREADMLEIAGMLVAGGADVNTCVPYVEDDPHQLSALYFALGHAGNLALARWLLERGADPNDNESLYHATELGDHRALKTLLDHGARPGGTNALLRAMDFHDVEAVRMLLGAGADPNEFSQDEVGGESPWVVPALHQAARRMAGREMCDVLIGAGADMGRLYQGVTPYGAARVYGNRDLAAAIEAVGGPTALTPVEEALLKAAEGAPVPVDPGALPEFYGQILRELVWREGKLDHIRALVAAGLPHDVPDREGLTPVQVAGWEGRPEAMAYFLSLGVDLDHINGFGGTLLSTILHGSENAPDRARRDHVTCARLALEAGVPLPRRAPEAAMEEEMAEFLTDWAEAHPDQVVEHGIV